MAIFNKSQLQDECTVDSETGRLSGCPWRPSVPYPLEPLPMPSTMNYKAAKVLYAHYDLSLSCPDKEEYGDLCQI